MSNQNRIIYTPYIAVFISGWLAAAALLVYLSQPPKKPPLQPVVITICSGCGAEWHSYGQRASPIKKCPNCPMSEAEFEALKERAKRSKLGGEHYAR